MQHGGKRAGAGRKPIDMFDPVTEYLVKEFDKEVTGDRKQRFTQLRRQAAKENSADLESLEILYDYYEQINLVPAASRSEMLKNPRNTVLEDIRYVFDNELSGKRGRTLAPLTKAELGQIYSRVAKKASAKFSKNISPKRAREKIKEYKRLLGSPF
jgi:hypothetical protein